SVGAIQRQHLQLETQGGSGYFGEPALDMADFMRTDDSGRGYISILAADRLMASPRLYATFLLWLLSELFERLPEVGDPEKPRLVFFFDEAHLLFDDVSDALEDKIEQVVRLIRSKGVGVYFVTQNPIDVPDAVAAQLGNRVQHALRAFTPRDQKAVKAAADTFRPNPTLDVESAITELKVGEALVSLLQADGSPTPVERILVRPPRSRVGPLSTEERAVIRSTSPIEGRYDQAVDRESAQEVLKAKGEAAAASAARATADTEAAKAEADQAKAEARAEAERAKAEARAEREARAHPSFQDEMIRQVGRSLQRQVANKVAGSLLRGILGGLFR
ncbi:MAG: ATP-binding protein, partial [Alphaproteobacteria bacterium]|nr:ATP-binding protein [Alphaproteobacteria bacterium]